MFCPSLHRVITSAYQVRGRWGRDGDCRGGRRKRGGKGVWLNAHPFSIRCAFCLSPSRLMKNAFFRNRWIKVNLLYVFGERFVYVRVCVGVRKCSVKTCLVQS